MHAAVRRGVQGGPRAGVRALREEMLPVDSAYAAEYAAWAAEAS